MNLGRELVAHIIRKREIKTFLDADLNLAWLSDKEDYSSAAIFGEEDEEAYRFVLRHYEQHRKTPSLALFEHSFPPDSYRLPRGSEFTADELLGLIQEDVTRVRTEQAGDDLAVARDDGDYDKAVAIMEAAAKRIRNARANRSVTGKWDDPDTDIELKINRVVNRGILTGIDDLDDSFSGFQKGNLITYLGCAKAGKSSFLIKSALNSWDRGFRVLFVTVEMTYDEISDRLDCQGSGISLERFQDGKLRPEEKKRLRRFRKEMDGWEADFNLVQTLGKYTISDLEDDIERYQPEVVYVDGFYFMIDRITGKPGANWEGHDNLSREMKETAMRREIILVTSTQAREKQLKKSELDDGAMMGGTGLIMASDMVLGFFADNKEIPRIHTISCTRSRTKYLPTIKGTWNWDTAVFTRSEEEEYDDADVTY